MAILIIWWELATHDQEKSVKFFEKVFGWEFRLDESVGFYKMKDGNFTLRRAKLPFAALYIQVDDILEKAKAIQEHGGFIVLTRLPSLPPATGYVCSTNRLCDVCDDTERVGAKHCFAPTV